MPMRDPQNVRRKRFTLSTRFTVLIAAATFAFGAAGAFLQQRSLYREKEIATRHAVEVAYGVLEHFGKLVYMEAVSLARSQGGGHFDYMWPKPGETVAKRKLSYVKLYPRWNWVIGSGIYVEDVQRELWSLIGTSIGIAFVV